MRKKLLQNSLFAAMAAWALYLAQTQIGSDMAMSATIPMTYAAAQQ
ncbi:MAG: hypothetical protein QM742_07850 [Aquabacterium sp.]